MAVGALADLLETIYTMFSVVAPTLRQTLAAALLTWAIDRHQVRLHASGHRDGRTAGASAD